MRPRTGAAALAHRPVTALAALVLGAGLMVLTGCAGAASNVRQPPAPTTSPRDPRVYASQIVQDTNNVRSARHLPRLTASRCARAAGLTRASNLLGKADLIHAPLAGVIEDCAPATTAAENLSHMAEGPAAVVDAWMRSPGHRSNLLDPTLTEIGVGCAADGPRMLCSQVFLGP